MSCAKVRGVSFSQDHCYCWTTVLLSDGWAVKVADRRTGGETVRDARYCDYYTAREAARMLRDYYDRTGHLV